MVLAAVFVSDKQQYKPLVVRMGETSLLPEPEDIADAGERRKEARSTKPAGVSRRCEHQ